MYQKSAEHDTNARKAITIGDRTYIFWDITALCIVCILSRSLAYAVYM